MNRVSRCSVRDPNVLASTASESPGKTRSESQIPLSSWNEQQPRTERPVMALAHQTTQNGILTKNGLLKSENLMKCWRQERRDPWVGNRSPSTQTSLSLMTMIWTLTPSHNQTFR